MRWTVLALMMWTAVPAAAGPLGHGVAGLEPGLVRLETTFDYSYRPVNAVGTAETGIEGLDGTAGISTGGLSLALALEPVRFVSFEARALLHKPTVEEAEFKGPWGWGFGGMLRLTPLHAAADRVHAGLYGAFDGQLIRYPSSPNAPLRLWNLRAGADVAFGNARQGWYAEVGAHYSRSWGLLTVTSAVRNADTGDVETSTNGYTLTGRVPFGVRLGAGLISAPIAPASNTRSRVQAGIDVRLIDEWAITIRLGAVL